MKLWFRLIGFIFTVWRRPAFKDLLEESRLRFRVWPSDLDVSLHMNNGRYLTLMDFGRLDFMVRGGLFKHIVKRGWTPVVSTALVRFRRELRCFQPFELETRIIHWTESHVLFEHRIIIPDGERAGEVSAYALVRAGLYDRKLKGYVPIEDLMALTDTYPDEMPAFDEADHFYKAEEILYSSARAKRREASD